MRVIPVSCACPLALQAARDAHVWRLQHEAVEQFVANMERYVAGKDLENIVDKAAGY